MRQRGPRRRAFLVCFKALLLALYTSFFSYPILCQALPFAYDIGPPHSTTASNGWFDTGGDVGGYLGVQNNELTATTAISVPPVVSTSRALSLRDDNRNKARSALPAKEAIPIGAVELMGVIGIGDTWKVTLKDCVTGETRTLREGETAFGYQVKSLTARGAILEGADEKHKLSIGDSVSSTSLRLPCEQELVNTIILTSSMPDLVRMGNTEREQWVAQWRRVLQTLNLEEQESARSKMRDYWRQQWEEQWEDVFSKMTPEEQESVRREISSYWKW